MKNGLCDFNTQISYSGPESVEFSLSSYDTKNCVKTFSKTVIPSKAAPSLGAAPAGMSEVTQLSGKDSLPNSLERDLLKRGASLRAVKVGAPLASVDSRAVTGATYKTRSLQTEWYDPLNITISSQTMAVKYGLGQGIAVYPPAGRVKLKEFQGCVPGFPDVCLDPTYTVSKSASMNTTGGESVHYDASAHFQNKTFANYASAGALAIGRPDLLVRSCGINPFGDPTADFYHNDKIVFNPFGGGSASYSAKDTKSGACTGLVKEHVTFGTASPDSL